MAVAAAAAAAAVDSKSVFRQALTALRYAVAAAVTVVVIITAVYAFHVVARTDNLDIDVVHGYISVEPQNQSDPKLSFTLSVDNPSGRVRFYYSNINCTLNVNDSRNSTAMFGFPDIVVAPDSVRKIGTEANLTGTQHLIDAFEKDSRIYFGANLTLVGNVTVGVFSVYNKSSVTTTYFCRSVIVGNVSGFSRDTLSDSVCYTNEAMEPTVSTNFGSREQDGSGGALRRAAQKS